jgi:ribosomal subunit interface protein
MGLEVSYRNIKPRDEIRRRSEGLYKKLSRFLDPAAEGSLLLGVEHGNAVLELVVTTRGQTFKSTAEDSELRAALDGLFHTMEGQLRRAKERRIDKRRQVGEDEYGSPEDDLD